MKKKKTSLGDWIFNIFLGLFFTLFTLICIYPFYYLIINTISANDISANGQIMFLPKGIHFQNYIDVFKIPDLASAALVSLGRTVLGTIGAVLGAAYLGFMFTQQKMWARKFWYRFTIITMYFNAGLIPWYITMRNLHLTNNFLAYILPAIVQPFNIILVKTYMESISPALQEAAEIDGASPWQRFRHITFPLLLPSISSAVVLNLIGGLKLYDVIVSLSGGGPGFSTHSLASYVSNQYFKAQNAGYSAAVGIFTFLFIMVVSNIFTNYFSKKEVDM